MWSSKTGGVTLCLILSFQICHPFLCPPGHPAVHGGRLRLPVARRRGQGRTDRVQEILVVYVILSLSRTSRDCYVVVYSVHVVALPGQVHVYSENKYMCTLRITLLLKN